MPVLGRRWITHAKSLPVYKVCKGWSSQPVNNLLSREREIAMEIAWGTTVLSALQSSLVQQDKQAWQWSSTQKGQMTSPWTNAVPAWHLISLVVSSAIYPTGSFHNTEEKPFPPSCPRAEHFHCLLQLLFFRTFKLFWVLKTNSKLTRCTTDLSN